MFENIAYINNQHIGVSLLCRTHMGSFRDGRVYELELIQEFYNRLTSNNKTSLSYFDIGANAGSYSLLPKVDSKLKCYAFEPNKTMFDLLKLNVENNDIQNNVECFNIGIWSEEKNIELVIPYKSEDSGLATFSENSLRFTSSEQAPSKKQNILCKTIDSLYKELKIETLDAIKIDVEGSELFVLMGAVNVLKKHKPLLLLEYYNDNTLSFGYKREKIVDFLKIFDYENFLIYDRSDIFAW